jgi:hypothetical protein
LVPVLVPLRSAPPNYPQPAPASTWWTIAGLVLGLAGALLNAKAADLLIRQTGGWGGGMSDKLMRHARRWSWPGWACIAGAFVCGAVAVLVK